MNCPVNGPPLLRDLRGCVSAVRFTDPVNTIEPLHLRKEVLMGQILNFPTKKIEPVSRAEGRVSKAEQTRHNGGLRSPFDRLC